MLASKYLRLVITSLLFFLVLIYAQVKINSLQRYHPLSLHRTLYLDSSFSLEDQQIITKATEEWNQKSHHVIDFQIKLLAEFNIKESIHSVLIMNISKHDPRIVVLDAADSNNTLGYCDDDGYVPVIYLVRERLGDIYLESVTEHELGHLLGLSHTTDTDSIMYPMADDSAMHITNHDLIRMCAIYNCNADELINQ